MPGTRHYSQQIFGDPIDIDDQYSSSYLTGTPSSTFSTGDKKVYQIGSNSQTFEESAGATYPALKSYSSYASTAHCWMLNDVLELGYNLEAGEYAEGFYSVQILCNDIEYVNNLSFGFYVPNGTGSAWNLIRISPTLGKAENGYITTGANVYSELKSTGYDNSGYTRLNYQSGLNTIARTSGCVTFVFTIHVQIYCISQYLYHVDFNIRWENSDKEVEEVALSACGTVQNAARWYGIAPFIYYYHTSTIGDCRWYLHSYSKRCFLHAI